MLKVNGRGREWRPGMTMKDVFAFLGYRNENPRAIVRVNGRIVPAALKAEFPVPDGADIDVIDIEIGG